MASSDFLENAISSKIDEKSLNDLTNSLESGLPNSPSVANSVSVDGGQRLVVRSVTSPAAASGGQVLAPPTVSLPTQPTPQRLVVAASSQQQIIRAGTMVMSGGQRLVGPGGQVIVAAPGQQLVRTSGGQILLQQPGQAVGQAGPPAVAAQPAARPPVSVGGPGVQRVVIPHPGVRPGQPGSQISVPLATLQALQAGQGIPTGTPGHLLVKTETGQYQILRVGPPAGGAAGPAAAGAQVTAARPAGPPVRLPTQPVAISRPSGPVANSGNVANTSPAPASTVTTNVASPAAAAAGGMGQQMTPDTAKIKCKNFLATLLRLASDQPESVARNVRTLIQGLIEGRVEPEVFTTRLQRELNSSPQPCLVPFLKKSLPYLQHSLATRELTIEGVTPPSLSQVGKLPPAVSTSSAISTTPSVRPVAGNTFVRPAAPAPQRPTFIRPALPTRPVQINTGTRSLMPPPASVMKLAAALPNPAAVVRDKKSGGAYSAAGDDDINDVAAMGGVNLQEEANSILGATDNVGSVIRSCKDESFLQSGLLHQRAARICRDQGLESPSQEVLNLISHATQERLKTLVSKLSVIAEHRLDIIKTEGPYVVTQDVKQQLRFLEDLDKIEKKKHDEEEKELLLKAAKSRSKTDDPEKEKLKAKAKEIQSIEAERIRHEEANKTALEAIGNLKKRKFGDTESKVAPSGLSLRSRTKRVHVRDLLFLMEQEKYLKHSNILFRSYCS